MSAQSEVPKAIFEMPFEDIDRFLTRIKEWKAKGIGGQRLVQRLTDLGMERPAADLFLDMARARKEARSKYPQGEKMFFTSEGLRWATPEIAAEHCAKRLAGAASADVTCGQGGQALSLARQCDRVVAIDLDPLNVLMTRLNLSAMGLDNVDVIMGDSLSPSIADRVEAGSRVFADPARPPGSPQRSMQELLPDPREIQRTYSGKAEGFCFEIPPYMARERIDIPCEKEYISIDRRLNRLNLYTPPLARSEVSAVMLPSGTTISGIPCGPPYPEPESKIHHAYEVDPAVTAAGLLHEAMKGYEIGILNCDDRRTLAFTEDRPDPAVFGDPYEILSICEEGDLEKELTRVGAGKAVLRFKVDPSEYWAVRGGLESRLTGQRKVHIFSCGKMIIAEKVSR